MRLFSARARETNLLTALLHIHAFRRALTEERQELSNYVRGTQNARLINERRRDGRR